MKRIVLYGLIACCTLLYVQEVHTRKSIRILFYNVENYFDCKDDSLKNDEDFLPGGAYGWNSSRFWHKTDQLAKVLAIAGEGCFPHLVGLAEVENEDCLRCLLYTSSLKQASYRYVYAESDDPRGIDICLLYNRFVFKPLEVEHIRVFPPGTGKKTRNILYVKGLLAIDELLHVFVCHWPSRYGGAKTSEPFRREAAKKLRIKIDSVFACDNEAKIVIMGDFNDEPNNLSICRDLGAGAPQNVYQPAVLYNLMWPYLNNPDCGSIKYQGRWSVFDQIIVSSALMYELPSVNRSQPVRRLPDATILFENVLLVQDKKYMGYKPFRTYEGFRYTGGFSDHLPVFLDIPF